MGFLGLEDRFTGTWNGGRSVTIYPDGTVVDVNTGEFVRLPYNDNNRGSNVFVVQGSQSNGLDPNLLLLALVLAFILALVVFKK